MAPPYEPTRDGTTTNAPLSVKAFDPDYDIMSCSRLESPMKRFQGQGMQTALTADLQIRGSGRSSAAQQG